MTLRQYLILMALGSLLAWTAVGVVVTNTNPATAAPSIFTVAYVSLYLALTGTLSLIGFALRTLVFRRDDAIGRQAVTAFRQGTLLAAVAIGALALESHALFVWWTALLLIVSAIVLEFFFISLRAK